MVSGGVGVWWGSSDVLGSTASLGSWVELYKCVLLCVCCECDVAGHWSAAVCALLLQQGPLQGACCCGPLSCAVLATTSAMLARAAVTNAAHHHLTGHYCTCLQMAAQHQVTLAQLQRNTALEARLLQQEAASQEAAARSEALQAALAAQHVAQQQQSSTLAARVQELEQQLRCGHPDLPCCPAAQLLCPAVPLQCSVLLRIMLCSSWFVYRSMKNLAEHATDQQYSTAPCYMRSGYTTQLTPILTPARLPSLQPSAARPQAAPRRQRTACGRWCSSCCAAAVTPPRLQGGCRAGLVSACDVHRQHCIEVCMWQGCQG